MICAWIETSSADTGSSATMKSGLTASARATPIRCRWPPENSCGYLVAASAGSPTIVEQLAHACVGVASRASSPCTRSGSPMMRPTL